MKEVEIKAHAANSDAVKAYFDSIAGEGKTVSKLDHYFRWPDSPIQAMRIRQYNGLMEMTAKHTHHKDGGEFNEEFEFHGMPDEYDGAVAFFHCLGLVDFFVKRKNGWEWNVGNAHVELLSVNSLGWFLEIEILLPFDSSDEEERNAHVKILGLMKDAGLDSDDIEGRSYREMILESEGGIQS